MLGLLWYQIVLSTLFVLVCIMLMGIILLQKGRGGGLSGAFGGAGGHSAFGAKTGDVFTWVTVILTGLFILLAVVSNYAFRPLPAPGATPPAAAAPAGGPATEDGTDGGAGPTEPPPATQPGG